MATIKRFEDLEIWQEARDLDRDVFSIAKKCTSVQDFEMARVLQKTSGSVMDNIAEGFEREGNKEFVQFLYIVKASLAELRSQTYRTLDRQYIDEAEQEQLMIKMLKLKSRISGMIHYLKSSDMKGYKFKEPEEDFESLRDAKQIDE